jgi:NAD(P)-dependent dehydrogenase (short-subunit alcohol dehydrogenase family)
MAKTKAKTSKSAPVVLITGANKGIGFEIAKQLAERGWQVVIAARNVQAGRAAAERIEKAGRAARFLELDVADSQSIKRAAAGFGKQFEHLDVLINNAGIYPDEGVSILTVSREMLVQTFQTNTLGVIAVTQTFLPYLRKAKAARIINMSSGYGQIEGLSASAPSYCLSKLALNGATIMFSEALSGEWIAVNAMSPGWVRTDMGGATAPRSVEEGADTAVWLAAEAPRTLTGKFIQDRKVSSW